MKYFKLTNSIVLEEIGKYEQSITTKIRGNLHDLGQKISIEEIILPEPILEKQAFATEYLHSVPIDKNKFLILKKPLINFLKAFNIDNYHSWDLKVHQNKSIINDYSLFHMPFSRDKICIDYAKSDFSIGKLGDWKDVSSRKPVKIRDFENFLNLLEVLKKGESVPQIRCNKLVFDLRNIKLDMFRLSTRLRFGSGYYISESIKNRIEEKKFTGMSFKEISEVNNRIEVIY